MVSEEDRIEIERLVNLKEADMSDKNSAQMMVRKYMDKGFKCCMTCGPAVVQMFKRLRMWWEKTK
jgi:hypothetical protein